MSMTVSSMRRKPSQVSLKVRWPADILAGYRPAIVLVALVILALTCPAQTGNRREAALHAFGVRPWDTASDGYFPLAGMVMDAAGNLYGTTSGGYGSGTYFDGTVFKLTRTQESWRETLVHKFETLDDGASPMAALTLDRDGNLYGTTAVGGPNGYGTAFRLSENKDGVWEETVLYAFGPDEENVPESPLTIDAHGNLYGTTQQGPPYDLGAVFELALSSEGYWTKSVLYDFNDAQDGESPSGALLIDDRGNLYGTTFFGGSANYGTVFELSHTDNGWTKTLLYSFSGEDGAFPSGLVADAQGNFYGTTSQGGENSCSPLQGCGTVFMLKHSPNGWDETVLHSFNGNDGQQPSGLTLDDLGNLWGTTYWGGSYANGVIFEIFLRLGTGWGESVRYSFKGGSDGSNPNSVMLDHAGNAYGTTQGGGQQQPQCGSVGCGLAFELVGPGSALSLRPTTHH